MMPNLIGFLAGSPLHFYNASVDVLFVVAVASFLGREPELYNETHSVIYRCYPGEAVYYVLVWNYMTWIRDTVRTDLCTARDVLHARDSGHNYSARVYRSNYYMEVRKVDLALLLLAICLLSCGAWLLYIAPLPPLAHSLVHKSNGQPNEFYS